MKVTIMGIIVAEGNELECAIYSAAFIETFRLKQEHDKKKEVDEWLKKYGDMTFEQLMNKEREEEE